MNPFISQLMEFIPERTVRMHTGVQFESADKTSCKQAERFAFIAQQLDWLTPLRVLTREEQVFLGLRAVNGRPQHEAEAGEAVEGDDEPMELDDELLEVEEVQAKSAAENPLMMPG